MKIKISELRKFLNESFQQMLAQEDTDRLRRYRDGYGETAFEEDVDRVRRHKDGYGDDLEEEIAALEAVLGTKDAPNAPQSQTANKSAALHTKDKSQMQGVGPRPNLATAFGDEPAKKEATAMITKPQPQSSAKSSAALHTKDKSQMQGVGPRPSLSTAFGDPEKKEALGEAAPSDAEEDFIKKNKEDFKKRYGAKYKDYLYGTAKKKFRK